jgi:hypothetical protein
MITEKTPLELQLANLLVDNTSCGGEEADKVIPMIFSLLNSNKHEPRVIPENLRALERLTAKQALEIDDLKIKLADDKEIIKDIRRKLTNIGAPLNGNRERYTEAQLRIFFEIQQILSV